MSQGRRSSTQLRKRKLDAFDPFANEISSLDGSNKSRRPPIKRRDCSFVEGWKSFDEVPSVSELAAPEEEEHLAINMKKAEELRQWIRSRMAMEHGAKTLLLTGPCGAAKTASLRLICDDLGVEVVEFDGNLQEYELNYAGDEIWERSALRVFVQFMRSAQFSSIERMSLKHRLLLIEQLPNIFYRDLSLFHNTLREFAHSRCMIAIVLSNIDSCWELNPQRLFPSHILDDCSIEHIKFGAISATNMTKAVKRMFATLNWKITGENSTAIRGIVSSANGDIRKAMNIMDFLMTANGKQKPSQRSRSIGLGSPSTVMPLSNGQVETFHFIGKLMYAKRSETVDERWRRCERMLLRPCRRKYARPVPPKDDINALIDSSFVSGNFLAGYVFEHEPMFAPSVSALASIASNICEFDVGFGSNMEANQLVDKYALDVVSRSAVFYNYSPDPSYKTAAARRGGLYQFKKPKLKEHLGKCDDTRRMSREIFSTSFIRSSDMETLTLPMLPALKFECTSRAQYNIVEKLRFPSNNQSNSNLCLKLPSSETSGSPAVFSGSQGVVRTLFLASQAQQRTDSILNSEDSYVDGFSYVIEEVP